MAMAPSSPELENRIQRACASFPVTVAYLFGSYVQGAADDESDVDIAVLVKPGLSALERHDMKLRLIRACSEECGMPLEKMDIVILQDVPVLLQLNVLQRGKLIFAKSAAVRRAFEIEVERTYEDERPYIERETELTLERILAHRA